MSRTLLVGVFTASLIALLAVATLPVAAASRTRGVTVSLPATARAGHPFVIAVRLPSGAAAVDGRILFPKNTIDVWGVAPKGGGEGLRPEIVPGGVAFGAYGLKADNGTSLVRIVASPRRAGRLQVGVAIDAVADRTGHRVPQSAALHLSTVGVDGGSAVLHVPNPIWNATPLRAPVPARDLQGDGRINKQDLDATRIGWDTARLAGSVCGNVPADEDANGDGCVDIVDVQATLAAQGRVISPQATLTGDFTFVVNNTADTGDAVNGDGICADSQGRCTLRAAMTESNWDRGNDIIQFNLPGPAPVTIQIGSQLPSMNSRTGTLSIDGYSQPGSSPNTATFGTNAVQGVEIRGPGVANLQQAFYVTSSGNIIRGLLIDEVNRGIFIDHPDAHDNRVIGNWIGFTRTGGLAGKGAFGVMLNTGAHHNIVGTPNLADRNTIGNVTKAVDQYGAGTDFNVIQNNVFCITPSGATAQCQVGTDHDFGPKNDQIGGFGPNEKNVYGPTGNQGIELSHGWNPNGVHGATDPTWEISGNKILGNWDGFRQDGNYDANYRSGRTKPALDNGNGINIIDGARNNTIDGNYVGSLQDGIQIMHGNAFGNVVQNNFVGVSPLGQPAPLTGWGLIARMNTQNNTFKNNIVRNAALGGVGLLNVDSGGKTQPISQNITISQNIISDTSGPAIFLASNPSDPSTTANHGIQPPVFTSVSTTSLVGTADPNGVVEVYRASRAVGLVGLPVVYLGSANVGPDGVWSMDVNLPNSDRITALQIDVSGDTSALAVNVLVGTPPPPPQSGDLIAADDFNRNGSGGWGTATQGGTWALIGTDADFSVNGTGRMSVTANSTREARLAINTADVDMTGSVSFDRLPTPSSASAFAWVVARANDTTSYRATIRVSNTGAVLVKLLKVINNAQSDVSGEVATGLTIAANDVLDYHFKVVGNHLQFRVWRGSDPEPGTWSRDSLDGSISAAGSAGLRAYAGGTLSNGPVTVSFDDFQVRIP